MMLAINLKINYDLRVKGRRYHRMNCSLNKKISYYLLKFYHKCVIDVKYDKLLSSRSQDV